MRHTCPDGTSTRLVRDTNAPVGDITAMHSCPNCGWAMRGDDILEAARKILFSEPTRRILTIG
jgi:hypothetical protein